MSIILCKSQLIAAKEEISAAIYILAAATRSVATISCKILLVAASSENWATVCSFEVSEQLFVRVTV